MPFEIERKFLVASNGWKEGSDRGTPIRQGYLPTTPGVTVRVRTAGDSAFITVKGPSVHQGQMRLEYEYEIPLGHAREMLTILCQHPVIEKVRHQVRHGKCTWYVDVFGGRNEGLVLAEVEMDHLDVDVPLPPWAGPEVTGNPAYKNSTLAKLPQPASA
jgi:CYTH domain-containing protein